jgi:hypothetical protein
VGVPAIGGKPLSVNRPNIFGVRDGNSLPVIVLN